MKHETVPPAHLAQAPPPTNANIQAELAELRRFKARHEVSISLDSCNKIGLHILHS